MSNGGPGARDQALRAIALEGVTGAEAARRVGVRRSTVSAWKNSAEGREFLQALRTEAERGHLAATSDARTVLRDATVKAARVLVAQLSHRDPMIAQSAAKTILDRAGLPRVEVVQSEAAPLNLSGFTEEELSLFEGFLRRAGGA